MVALPVGLAGTEPNWIELRHTYEDLEPVKGATYKVTFDDGSVREGTLDGSGFARIDGVKSGVASVEYGEDTREWKLPEDRNNGDFGAGTDDASAQSLYAKYFGDAE
jgi:type VI secretion system secreted protein VgrG